MVMQGETGLIRMNGVPEEPAKIPLSICDINAAMEAALGTLAALYHRSNGGSDQTVNVSMFGGMTDWLGYFPTSTGTQTRFRNERGRATISSRPTDPTRRPTTTTSTSLS